MLVSPDDATNCFIFRVVMPSLELTGHVLKFTRGSHANPQQITTVSKVFSSAQAKYK